MENNSSQVSCRACGAGVSPASSICDYCGNPVRITTLKSTVDLSKPLLMKYVKLFLNYKASAPEIISISSLVIIACLCLL